MPRHRKVLRDNIQGVTQGAIRRLARRGGVKRISNLMYEETRSNLKVFLEGVIRRAVTMTDCAQRKTVSANDVVYALRLMGRPIYGMNQPPTRRARTDNWPPTPHGPRGADAWIRDASNAPTVGYGVSIKTSRMTGGGNGLFADRVFAKGDIITRYSGHKISREEAGRLRREDAGNASHMRKTGDQRIIIDGLREPEEGRGGGSFANQAVGGQAGQNSKFHNVGGGVVLVATKPIRRGTEVTIFYGADFVWGH
jgi:histone H4